MPHKHCIIEGCNNQGKPHRNGYRYFSRGYCSSHYKKFAKENRDIIELDKIRPNCCSVDGCDKPKPYKKGLCDMHYQRLTNNGDVNIVQKRREVQTTHPLYDTYGGMKKRCLSKTDKDYPRYGGRGILICDRWLGVDGFFNFSEDMGERPNSYTLDRKDTNGNYCKENCRWADVHTQSGNKINSQNTGASYVSKTGKYRVRISVSNKTYTLGLCNTLQEALELRRLGEIKYLGRQVNDKN
jgi:hypothetical protein